MKDNIKLLSFDLELYDINNESHNELFNELWIDDNTKKYLYDKNEFISNIINGDGKNNCIYIVKSNNDYIGFVSLYYSDNTYEICDGILPAHRGKGYSTRILKEFSEYVFNNTDITELYGYIDKENIASIKSALGIGFINTKDKEYILKK